MKQERRRFFRIDDIVGVCYRRLGPEEARVFAAKAREHGGNFDYAANFDNRIQTLLDSCRIQTPVAAELLDLLNKKLNFVMRQMDIEAGLLQQIAYELKQVNISACGMAFANDEYLDRGEMLQLDILLKPGDLQVVALAEVVASEPLEPEPADGDRQWFLRLNFVELNPNDQELLIQHVVKRQSAALKARRQAQQN